MAKQYGIVKVDFITYTSGGDGFEVDQTIDVSGLSNISDSGITVTGTISGVSGIFSENLFVNGSGTFNDLIVNNNATIGGDLTVSGNINASGVTISGITGLFASGTEAAPSISFVGDSNTGFYNAAANEVRITTDGNDRLTVDSAGNVGIGTTAPSGTFHVNQQFGVLNSYLTSSDNSSANIYFGDQTSATEGRIAFDNFNDGNNFRFYTGGSERLRIDKDGNVGIGTTDPVGSLNVQGPGAAPSLTYDTANLANFDAGGVQLALGVDSNGPFGCFLQGRDNADSARSLLLNPVNGNVGIGITGPAYRLHVVGDASNVVRFTNTANNSAYLTLQGNTTTQAPGVGAVVDDLAFNTAFSERMRIDSTGRVLIGLTSALSSTGFTSNLQVKASTAGDAALSIINTSNDAFVGGLIVYKSRDTSEVQAGDGLAQFRFAGYDGSTYIEGARISAFVDDTPGTSNMPGRLVFSTTAAGASSPTNRMTIKSDGNVGIGTTNPSSELQVSSGAGTTINIEATADNAAGRSGNLIYNFSDGNGAAIAGRRPAGGTAADVSLIFRTGGSTSSEERMRIASNGNVGIDSTDPGSRLEVEGDTTTAVIHIKNAFTAASTFDGGGTGLLLTSNGMNTTSKFTPAIRFGSTDPDFVTQNPKTLAAINGIAKSGYSSDTAGAMALAFYTSEDGSATDNVQERMRIESNGKVGIGTKNPDYQLSIQAPALGTTAGDVVDFLKFQSASSNADRLKFEIQRVEDGTDWPSAAHQIYRQVDVTKMGYIQFGSNDDDLITFGENNTEYMRIDGEGRLLVGTTSATNVANNFGATTSKNIQVKTDDVAVFTGISDKGSTSAGPIIALAKSRNGAIVQDSDRLGEIKFAGFDGTDYQSQAAIIRAEVEGTPGVDDMPCRLMFFTTSDGNSTPTERMRISSNGNIGFNFNSSNGNDNITVGDTISTSITQRFVTVRGQTNAGATNVVTGFSLTNWSGVDSATPYTTSRLYGYNAAAYTPGNNQTITEAYGVQVSNGWNFATNNYGFYSNIGAGVGNFNFYANGTADNYFAGTIASLGSYNNTTASAANVFIASNGDIQRSTSSIRYKTDVENLEQSYTDNVILNARPVWYRSLCEADNAGWSYYGLIAEEIAKLDPRLVFWGRPTKEVLQEEAKDAVLDNEGNVIEPATDAVYTNVEDTDAELQPEGVQYDRLTVLLIDVVQRQQKAIEALEAKVAALEAS